MLNKTAPFESFEPENTRTSVLNGRLKLYTFPHRGEEVRNVILLAHSNIGREDYSYFCGLLQMHYNRRFQVPPGLFICFYTPHKTVGVRRGKSQSSFLTDFMVEVDTPFEIISPQGYVHNYQLAHCPEPGGEPIASDDDIKLALWHARCIYDLKAVPAFDIITTEPSWPSLIRLQDVVDTLRLTGQFYTKIHCLICRYVFGDTEVYYDFIQGNASAD